MTGETRLSLMKRGLFLTVLISVGFCGAEIRNFNGLIEADSSYIHYSEGFLVTPGYVDLSRLIFSTGATEAPSKVPVTSGGDDGLQEGDHEESTHHEKDGGGRSLNSNFKNEEVVPRNLADGTDAGSTMIDIVLFPVPNECAKTRKGCDWTELGVGASDGHGNLRWCCAGDAVDFGFCDGGPSHTGRLIVNSTVFQGQHRVVTIPRTGDLKTAVKYGRLEQSTHSGKYVLVIANCNDKGRDVLVTGPYSWRSAQGYLPGDLFGEMYFLLGLTLVYLALILFYGICMKIHEESIIPIQKWILLTIGMGVLEGFFKTGDLFVWDEDGTRFWFANYTGVILGVMKRAISRCLVLMVSLGWGVVRDSLGSRMKTIMTLGLIYCVVSSARDISTLFEATENQKLSTGQEKKLFDLVTILTFVVAAIDVTFYMWILDALNGTMQYLENMNQTTKLKRYLRLRCILLFSILFAVMWAMFILLNRYMTEAILEPNQEWAIDASWGVNYLIILIGVAWLWRPNSAAKDYAYVMELPALGADGDESGFNAVPHPDDDDDEDQLQPPGYKDNSIDDAVMA
mmetsp:Transcript_35804/g.55091  ORF Transcript_35804/g.55091 Transcript_35804/m.55091 type:complete len:569 (+) Transcript_35804:63-1769(+)